MTSDEQQQHATNDMDSYMCIEANCESTRTVDNSSSTLSNKSCEEMDDAPDVLLYPMEGNGLGSERRGLEKSPLSLGKGQ